MGKIYLTEAFKSVGLTKAYLVENGVTVNLPIAYDVEDKKTVLLWSESEGGGFVFVTHSSTTITVYSTKDGITVEQIGTCTFGNTYGPYFAEVVGNYLWMGGYGGTLVKMSLADGTYTTLNPLYTLAGGTASGYRYCDIKEVNGTIYIVGASTSAGSCVVYSGDGGTTWSYCKITSYANDLWIEYLNGIFHVLTDGRKLFSSADLDAWTSQTIHSSSSYTMCGMVAFENRLVILSKTSSNHYIKYSEVNPGTSPTFTSRNTGLSFTISEPAVANGILFILDNSGTEKVLWLSTVAGDITTISVGESEKLYSVDYQDGLYLIGTDASIMYNASENLTSGGYFEHGNYIGTVKYVIARG